MGEIESIIRNARLVEIDNVWVLLYKNREYIRLLDAKSRDDAEQQIAELLLVRDPDQHDRDQHHPRTLTSNGMNEKSF